MVDTLEKPEQIVIPPGTSSETIITLSRKGSHQLGNPSYRGDHHVHIQVCSNNTFSILRVVPSPKKILETIKCCRTLK